MGGRFLDRWPALREVAERSPIVAAVAAQVDRGEDEREVMAHALACLAQLQRETMDALVAAKIYEPPPPVVVDGRTYDYVGPCATCGRSGPRSIERGSKVVSHE